MKKTLKTKICAALAGVCLLAVVASAGTYVNVAKAEDGAVNESYVLTMQEGASIRAFEPTGIRFVSELEKTDYEALLEKGAEFYTLILPEKLVPEGGITADNYNSLNADIVKADKSIETDGDKVTFNGTLVGVQNEDGSYSNFPEAAYSYKLTGVSYYTYSEGDQTTTVFASNPQTYSIAYIASALQAKGYSGEYYAQITDSVLGDTLAFDQTEYTLEEGSTLATTLSSQGLKAVYSGGSESVFTIDESGTLTGVAAGTATLTATIGNKTATASVTVNAKKPLEILSGSSAKDLGYTENDVVICDFGEDNDSYDNVKIENGVLTMTDDYIYEFNEAVELEAGAYSIVIRYKGNGIIYFYDSNGTPIFYKTKIAGKENDYDYSAGQIDLPNHSWGGGINITVASDTDGYKILTVTAEKLVANNFKQMKFDPIGSLDIDYIVAVKAVPVISGGSAKDLGYTENDVIVCDFGEDFVISDGAKIESGELKCSFAKAGESYSLDLKNAIDLTDVESIKIRVKGNGICIRLSGTDGYLYADGTDNYYKNRIAYIWSGFYSLPSKYSYLTKEKDGDSGYTIITLHKEAFKVNDITKIEFEYADGQSGTIDYIVAVKATSSES